MALVLWLSGIVASAFFSWLFTHSYYKRSLREQAGVASEQLSQLMKLVSLGTEAAERDRQLARQRRIEEGLTEYKRAGTPVRVIDTYGDLSNEEKAELLDAVMLRAKGRKAKVNKYRQSD